MKYFSIFSITLLTMFILGSKTYAQIPTDTPTSQSSQFLFPPNSSLQPLSQMEQINNRLATLEDRIDSRLSLSLSAVSWFATVMLGVFALIGGFLIWNGHQQRQEAKDALEDIKLIKTRSTTELTIISSLKAKIKKDSTEIEKKKKELEDLFKQINDSSEVSQATKDKIIKLSKELENNYKNVSGTLSNYASLSSSYAHPIDPNSLYTTCAGQENKNYAQSSNLGAATFGDWLKEQIKK